MWELRLSTEESNKYSIVNMGSGKSHEPNGRYQFINRVDEPGIVRLGQFDRGNRRGWGHGHTSMAQDGINPRPTDVYLAGEFFFEKGRMTKWNNDSGHYFPDELLENSYMIPHMKRLLPEQLYVGLP
ncbi:hypothetical protein [Serratia quinivorans]|uniref:hypothetical protein n=1 Tax=Serratia quinivorans TaxID=137545 RepID=UPI0021B842C7|nr:hypothetical protein [Serratia quinivorans]